MTPVWLYYVFATLLCATNVVACFLNLVSLPGNWLIICFSGLFAWLVRTSDGRELSWPVVVEAVWIVWRLRWKGARKQAGPSSPAGA